MADEITQDIQQNSQEHHTERQWQKKFFGMGAKCYYCDKPLLLKEASKDHKTPKCRGGSDSIRNIVPACLPCNQKKGWRTEAEFRQVRPALQHNPDNPQPIVSLNKTNHELSLDERLNEPGLLRKVMSERDGMRASWAWRNPA